MEVVQKVKIVIIDDHKMIREGLRQLLELDGEICVIGEAGDGAQGLEVIHEMQPDVVLLDINMPVMNGLDMLKNLREKDNNIKVVILTIHNEIEYLEEAIDIGVNGYILKDSECSSLKKAIFTVFSGNSFIDPSLSPLLKESRSNGGSSKVSDKLKYEKLLSSREIDILKLVAKGMKNREIANILGISEKTVKNHVSSVLRKLDADDRTKAAVIAIKHNIIKM